LKQKFYAFQGFAKIEKIFRQLDGGGWLVPLTGMRQRADVGATASCKPAKNPPRFSRFSRLYPTTLSQHIRWSVLNMVDSAP
jgi:hypothetical protein